MTSVGSRQGAAQDQGGGGSDPIAPISWTDLSAEEQRRVERRRRWLTSSNPGEPLPEHKVGLALSGGGIRSATFSLGVLRALSRLGILRKVDYLSTVSGGGYAGSFYCSLFVPQPLRGTLPHHLPPDDVAKMTARRAEDLGKDPLGGHIGKRAVEQLREGGHFLNPNGTSDSMFAAVVAFRNWLAIALVTGISLLAIFLAINLVRLPPETLLRNAASWVESQTTSARPAAVATATPPTSAEVKEAAPHPEVNCAADIRPGDGGVSARCSISPAAEKPEPRKLPKIGAALGASWLWILAALLVPLWAASCAWAYWLTRSGDIPRSHWARLLSGPTLVALAWSAVLALMIRYDPDLSVRQKLLGAAAISSALIGILLYAWAGTLISREEADTAAPAADAQAARVAEENRVRTRLSRWLFSGVFLILALAGLALIDDAGRLVYHNVVIEDYARLAFTTGTLGGLSLIVPAARWFLKRVQSNALLSRPKLGPLLRRFGRGIALIVGILLLFALLTFWSALATAIVWHGKPVLIEGEFVAWEPLLGRPWLPPILITLFAAVCAIILGRGHSFLNQSSLASFYAGRLRKAYLGASNVERIATRTAADLELPSDEIGLGGYYHPEGLAPVHLINVTINETTSESSRVIQRDRKGKGMTISPAGYIFVQGAPSSNPVGFRLDQGEQLPLSTWMGISGAAFSTGMGQHTTLGVSLLAGLTNLRLGYWWNSPYPGRWRGPRASRAAWYRRAWRRLWDFFGDLVQAYLLREIRADHEGTHANRWYLSDGGHFENMALYELVRRRVPFIIACDNGADPNYEFADFVNMVRKIRIDFEAETELVSNDDLDQILGADSAVRRAFGTLEDMVPKDEDEKGQSGPYAALVRIRYLKEDPANSVRQSTLLLIKPRVTGGELPDLLRYKKSDVSFPQQPTTDLFFDEAQWESYFRLGQLITEAIFQEDLPPAKGPPPQWAHRKPPPPRPWRPVDLQPLP